MSDDVNVECQQDELLALASIYDDRVFVAGTEDSMSGTVNIFLELPQPFEVQIDRTIKCKKSVSLSTTMPQQQQQQQDSAKMMEVFEIKYLPPLVLDFSLPPCYPSSAAPNFTLTCKWLTVSQLTKICQLMDSLWEESSFNVILFQWIQFLQEEVITQLEIRSPLLISPRMFTKHGVDTESLDVRAVQDVSSCAALLDIILNFDQNERDRVFQTNYYSCGVCFNEKQGSVSIAFPKCNHVFCTECISEYFKVQIEDGSVKSLVCPDTKCDSQALPSQVKQLVSPELFTKYDQYLLQSSLDEMTDVVYCPRPQCQSPVILENGATMGICLVCRFAFCSLCKLTYHGISPCVFKPDEVKKLKMQYENANPSERLFLERRYGKNRIRRMIDDLVSEQWLQDNSKTCPRCGAKIQKLEGCNKMTCMKCRSHFCWLCGKILSHQNPYIHFNMSNSSCFNRLFEGVDIDSDNDDDEDFLW